VTHALMVHALTPLGWAGGERSVLWSERKSPWTTHGQCHMLGGGAGEGAQRWKNGCTAPLSDVLHLPSSFFQLSRSSRVSPSTFFARPSCCYSFRPSFLPWTCSSLFFSLIAYIIQEHVARLHHTHSYSHSLFHCLHFVRPSF